MIAETYAYILSSKTPLEDFSLLKSSICMKDKRPVGKRTPLGQCYLKCGILSWEGVIQLVDHPIYFLQHLAILENVIGLKEVWIIMIFKHCTGKAAVIVMALNTDLWKAVLRSALPHWLLRISVNTNTT